MYHIEFMAFYRKDEKDDAYSLDLDGGMKLHDIGAFIDKGEYYCSRTCGAVKCKEKPKFFIDANTFRMSSSEC